MDMASKEPTTTGTSRMPFDQFGPAWIALELENTTDPTNWPTRPVIEFWSARQTGDQGSGFAPQANIALDSGGDCAR